MSQNAFIAALLFDGQGGAVELDQEQVNAWQPEQGTLWVHIDYANEQGSHWLSHQSGVGELVADALLSHDTRPRVSHVNEQSLIFLRGVNLSEGASPEDMVSVRIVIDAQRIISTRRRKLLSVSDLIQSLHRGEGPVNSSDFLVRLCHYLTLRIDAVAATFEDRIAQIEELVLEAEDPAGQRKALMEIRRQTIHLRRYLAPQREAMLKMMAERKAWLLADDRLYLQESTDRLIRSVEELDAVRERAVVTQEELVSQVNDQMNQRMYVMSLIAALFLPLGFLTGLLGVNIGGIPGTDNPGAFLWFSAMLVVVMFIILGFFRLKRWF
ncbi:zinc transporter ZntB [Vibrio gazogenes]|uniref:Zinc transporter n=1 Tax=Vibrio gazogenes DSM 21264 = NBRC 103151 TaxID=1123492 RepID=A0A1M4TZH5_VIBGA|nr:zinc transporter ZntB [Vibrio gazogenes]USP16198.1 zinc transporter ZntB [Vibrio gazogenes]SHE49912.1 zinc transporter [Vibrio gazogenes DSM 21264] [Vibrio gazogenes DSM 21264 = NBRC 103151]SJN53098.1 Zinc transport protein ZntB [Vibrio gazogenes]